MYEGAVITEDDGKVGINTDAPAYELDVGGNTNVSGTYKIGGLDVLSATFLGNSVGNVTSVGTLTGLNVSGNTAISGNLAAHFPTEPTKVNRWAFSNRRSIPYISEKDAGVVNVGVVLFWR